MGLLSFLKHVEKDLRDVGGWIDDGIKFAQPIISLVDPPLGEILLAVEEALGQIPPETKLDPKILQTLITSETFKTRVNAAKVR